MILLHCIFVCIIIHSFVYIAYHFAFILHVMHGANDIIHVKFSFSFRHDIVCTVHLRLVQQDEPDRFCILRVKLSKNYMILLHPFCIVV